MTTLAGHRPFLLFVSARAFSEFSYQIGTVAIGWQVYALTGSAFALGMVGLVQFIPSALLVFAAGHVARGRVGAVNYLFVNTSNQLGEFESGLTAALFGAVPAVILGGVGTIAIALLWMKLFPSLRRVNRFSELHA